MVDFYIIFLALAILAFFILACIALAIFIKHWSK